MFKKLFFIIVLGVAAFSGIQAQQLLSRFAVVDLPRVYTAFFRESRAVRDFEESSRRVQRDIDRMTQEINELRSRHADAVLQGNEQLALRLNNEIFQKSEFLRDFYTIKTAELEEQRRRLAQSNTFLDQVYDEIRFIAESEGFSMVINLRENASILWHSSSVDITDRLIQNLLEKARR